MFFYLTNYHLCIYSLCISPRISHVWKSVLERSVHTWSVHMCAHTWLPVSLCQAVAGFVQTPGFWRGRERNKHPIEAVLLEIEYVLYLVCFMKGAGCSLSRDLSRSALQIPSVKISDAKDTHSIMRRTRPNAFADAESLGICCYEVLSISTLFWISLRVWIQCPLRLLWRRRRDEALFFRMKWSWALSSDSGWREMNVTTSVLGKGTGLVQ